MSFKDYKQTKVSKEVEVILDEPLINMLLSIAFNHAKRRDYDVECVQLFELYQFEEIGMHILGLVHLSDVTYTRVEMRHDIFLPYDSIIIAIRDDVGCISVERVGVCDSR